MDFLFSTYTLTQIFQPIRTCAIHNYDIGLPSAPNLAVRSLTLQSFDFTITPPLRSSQCVQNYTITANSNGTVLPDIVAASDGEEAVTIRRSGFDLCYTNYTFTVVAVTLAGSGERSAEVNSNSLCKSLHVHT